ncbi:MAG: InlB B-repeat-containing protein [Lachnospiraceae bacterium]|nr:InlB B-repeat-containing protein [Lachnospiraceae bacterium]
MQKKKEKTRFLACLLAVIMTVTIMPFEGMPAYAGQVSTVLNGSHDEDVDQNEQDQIEKDGIDDDVTDEDINRDVDEEAYADDGTVQDESENNDFEKVSDNEAIDSIDEVKEEPLDVGEHVHCICGSDDCNGEGHDRSKEWTAWESDTELPTEAGYYYLTKDVTLSGDMTAEDGVFLCLNGKTVDMNGHRYKDGGSLTVTNCKGKNTGAIEFAGESKYYSGGGRVLLSALNLSLYNTKVYGKNIRGDAYLVGYYGNDTSSLYIDNCIIQREDDDEYSSDDSVLVNSQYPTNVTINNSTLICQGEDSKWLYGVSVFGLKQKLIMENTTIYVEGKSNFVKAFSVSDSKEVTDAASETVSVKNCEITAKTTSPSTSGYPFEITAVSAESAGFSTFSYEDCTINAESTGSVDTIGFSIENGGASYEKNNCTGKLTDCSIMAKSAGMAQGISAQTNLDLTGSIVSAAGSSDRGHSMYLEPKAGSTINITDTTVTGVNGGLYFSNYNYPVVNLKNAVVTANAKGSYGIYTTNGSIYLGGDTIVNGEAGGIYKSAYSNYSNTDYNRPAIYAYSKDNSPLTIADGKKLTVYYAYQYAKQGDQIITEGMNEALVGKLTISYPKNFSIDKDGKLVTPKSSTVDCWNGGTVVGGSASAFTDPECTKYLPSGKAFEGDTVYIKATPNDHFVFTEWEIRQGNIELADSKAAVTSFVMGSEEVQLYPRFTEAPSYVITYKGGSQSDGSVKDFTGKKYHGDAAKLSTKVFINKDQKKSQVGWSTSDGGPKVYDLGGEYATDKNITLYPYWESNYTITFMYGDYPAPGHKKGDIAGTMVKIPREDKYLRYEDITELFGYELYGEFPSQYYIAKDSNGNIYRFTGLSVNSDGSTYDYGMSTGGPDCLYTQDADITLYPAWTPMYCIRFSPGKYGIEREEPLDEIYKFAGKKITLPGRILSDNTKVVAYESKREWFRQGGWSLSEEGTTKDFALAGDYNLDQNATLYPYWETVFKVEYHPGDYGVLAGEPAELIIKKYAGVSINVFYGLFVRPGYIQTGWNTKKDGSGTTYRFGSSYNGDENLTLYPIWEGKHKITYMPDEKTDRTKPVYDTKYPGQAAVIKAGVFTAPEHTLTGYTKTKGSQTIDFRPGDSYESEEDLTVYPVWSPKTYGLWIGDTQVTGNNRTDILGNGKASYDPETETLVLNGISITDCHNIVYAKGQNQAGIYATDDKEEADILIARLNIRLTGENTINPVFDQSDNGYGIVADAIPVVFEGSGKLTVGNASAQKMLCAVNCATIRLSDATLDLYSQYNTILTSGSRGHEGIRVESGSLSAIALADGATAVYSSGYDAPAVHIMGGKVTLTTKGASGSVFGGESTPPVALNASATNSQALVVDGGEVNVVNEGKDGYGMAVELDGNIEDVSSFYGVSINCGNVTINTKNGIVPKIDEVVYTPLYLGEDLIVKAGEDAEHAVVVNDFSRKYTEYKYAKLTGGKAKDNTYLYIGETAVTDANLSGSGWSYEPGTSTLTINDLRVDVPYVSENALNAGIYTEGDLNLVVNGNASVGYGTQKPEYGIFAHGNINITGTGKLDIFATDQAIRSGMTLNVDAKLNVETSNPENRNDTAIYGDEVIIKGGNVDVTATGYGIESRGDVDIRGGNVTVNAYKHAVDSNGYIQSAGDVKLISTATEDASFNYFAMYTMEDITLNGGTLYTEAQYTAVRCLGSSGTLTVNAGLFQAFPRSKRAYKGNTTTPTIIYSNVDINGGRLEATGSNYGIFTGSNTIYPKVNIYGGSVLIDLSEAEKLYNNYAIFGPINVYLPSSRYSYEKGGRTYVRTGSYSINCRAHDGNNGYDYLNVATVQTVSYRPGTNGTGEALDVAKEGGDRFMLEGALYTRAGFAQGGWSLTDGGEKAYDLYEIYDQDADIVLYPYWTTKNTITYKPGIAKETKEYIDDVAGNCVTELRGETYTLAKAGYKQSGWNTKADGTGTGYKLLEKITVTQDMILYPVFAEEKITIIYDKGSAGIGTNVSEEISVGSEVTLKGAMFTREGYKQIGWALTEDGDKVYEFGEKTVFTENTTLYPAWEKEKPAPPPIPEGMRVELEDVDSVDVGKTGRVVYIADYTGAALKPVVKVYDGDRLLIEKKDYTIAFKNNTNANMIAANTATGKGKLVTEAGSGVNADQLKKMPLITVTGKGNYSDKLMLYFSIRPHDISEGFSAGGDLSYSYTEKKGVAVVNKPIPVISGTLNGKAKKLAVNKEFNVSYYNAVGDFEKNADGSLKTAGAKLPGISQKGKYVVKAEGAGNYAGTLTIRAEVTDKKLINKAKVTYPKKVTLPIGYKNTPVTLEGVTVKLGKTELKEGNDYTIEYRNNYGVGTATMIIVGRGEYAGTASVQFTIMGVPVNKLIFNNYPKTLSYVYNGSQHILPTANVKDNSKIYLTYQADKNAQPVLVQFLSKEEFDANKTGVYAKYITNRSVKGNNITVGTATVELIGSGACSGTVKKNFKINGYDLNSDPQKRITVEYDKTVPYAKDGAAPSVKVSFKDAAGNVTVLDETSVRISFKNNKAVNNATAGKSAAYVRIDGTGNFKGKRTRETFKITTQSIKNVTVIVPDKGFVNKADNYMTAVSVYDTNGGLLKAGTDYEKTVTYRYAQNVTVVNKGKNIERKQGNTVQKGDIVPSGTKMTAVITGRGNYNETAEKDFYMTKGDISKAKVSFKKKFYYNKDAQVMPTEADIILTVKDGKNNVIVPAGDYEIVPGSFVNNTKKGNGSFVVIGKNNHGGALKVKFSIWSRIFKW